MSESDLARSDRNRPNSETANPRVVALKLEDSIGLFPELVAGATPTPGGGSVAALSGLMASSLGQMVCNITIGKPKYAANEPRLKELAREFEQLGARLRELIGEDAESFEAVMKAYRLPKESDDEKRLRSERIQEATLGSIKVPLETAARSLDALRRLRELADIGNTNAISDVAVGAQMAVAAVKGASYNVRINLGSLADKSSADEALRQVRDLIEQSQTIAAEIESKV